MKWGGGRVRELWGYGQEGRQKREWASWDNRMGGRSVGEGGRSVGEGGRRVGEKRGVWEREGGREEGGRGREECGRGRENLSFVSLFTTGHEVGLVSL